MRSYFDVLGIEKKLNIDTASLEKIYYDLSRKNHPDLFLSKGDDKYKKALDESSIINKAYNVLKDPMTRAGYVLETDAPQVAGEKSNIVHNDLLEEVMEMQEKIEDHHSADEEGKKKITLELKEIKDSLSKKLDDLKSEISRIFSEYDSGVSDKENILRKLKAELHKRNYINTLIRTIDSEIFGAERIRH